MKKPDAKCQLIRHLGRDLGRRLPYLWRVIPQQSPFPLQAIIFVTT